MSWLKTAFSKAAEAGGKNLGPNLSRTVKTYAGSVYQQAGQAVAGGAKIVQDRLAGRNLNNFKQAVRRLDEVALSARGEERKQALARWLSALQDIHKEVNNPLRKSESDVPESPKSGEEEPPSSPSGASMVLFFDAETGSEPVNFRDVFLRSHAVENIVTSVILDAPSAEEVTMLLEIFGLCLTGGQELHHAVVSSIQDLSKVAASYEDEVLTKRDELLGMARDAVSGLKKNPEVERLDEEIGMLHQQIAEKEGLLDLKGETLKTDPPSSGPEATTTADILQLQLRLRLCIQRKSAALQTGDSPEERAKKVQKLKDVTCSLTTSTEELQKELLDNQQQKQDAVKFRTTKAQEVTETEKVVAGEVHELDKRRQVLEAELKEVKAALAAATARHIHTQEEKEQFDEASSNMVAHLSHKEDGLSRSISARTVEASVVNSWVNFLEDTGVLQSSTLEQIFKDNEAAWEKSKQHFFQIAATNLVCRQEEAKLLLKRLKLCVEELESLKQKRASSAETAPDGGTTDITKEVLKAQNTYLETEAEVERMFTGIAQLEEEMDAYQAPGNEQSSEEQQKLRENLEAIALLKKEIDALERPEIEQEKVEKKAMQQGRALFEKARSQVIETGDKIRAATAKLDSSKDMNYEASPKIVPQTSPQPKTGDVSGDDADTRSIGNFKVGEDAESGDASKEKEDPIDDDGRSPEPKEHEKKSGTEEA